MPKVDGPADSASLGHHEGGVGPVHLQLPAPPVPVIIAVDDSNCVVRRRGRDGDGLPATKCGWDLTQKAA
jgi:hypothetical protein